MLPARFHQIRDRAVVVVDRVMAEPLRLSPMADGRADPDRPQHPFEAVMRVSPGAANVPNGGAGKGWASSVAAGRSMVAIDPRNYTGPPIREGDKIRALSRPAEPAFIVTRIDDRDGNRLVLELDEL